MQDPSTLIGGTDSRFQSTHWSLVRDARRSAPAPLEKLVRIYWKPVYAYIRKGWDKSNEDAKDLTQAFFLHCMSGTFLSRVDSSKGRFRTFVRACLDNFLRDERTRERALKRGGGRPVLSLDFVPSDGETGPEPFRLRPQENRFDREWRIAISREAVRLLREHYEQSGREIYFRVFEAHSVSENKVTYSRIAANLGIKETDVSNFLVHARRKLRDLIRGIVRETVAEDSESSNELAYLFGQ